MSTRAQQPPGVPARQRRSPARGREPAHVLRDRARRRPGRRRRQLHAGPRPLARHRRRVGLGQDHPLPLDHGPAPPPQRHPRGLGALRGHGAHDHEPPAAPEHLGRRDGDDLPGPHDLAQPGHEGRQADRRAAAHPPRHEPLGRHGHRAAPAGGRRHPGAREAARPVPARAVGRHAPAHHDRHGPGLRAHAPLRRRAHHRPRRDRAGADPRPDPGAAPGPQHVGHPRHPRPRRRGRPHRRDHRHVRRADRGAGADAGAVQRDAHALHGGSPREHPQARRPEPHPAAGHRRAAARPDQPAEGLPVQPPLPVRAGAVP